MQSYKSYCVIEERVIASFRHLGVQVSPEDAEMKASRIFQAMSKPSRIFHSVEHVIELSAHVDALGCLAALYHDFIYLQLDHGFGGFAEELRDICRYEQGRVYLQSVDENNQILGGLCDIFGVKTTGGLIDISIQNEFVSAVVAMLELQPLLTARDIFMVFACIEATIPFRGEDKFPGQLVDRLNVAWGRLNLPRSDADIDEAMFRAVDLANRDVANFSSEQAEEFLKNTWSLISESSPHILEVACGIRSGRIALLKMYDFLEALRPNQIYHAYKGCPPKEELDIKESLAEKNLVISRQYLKVQLCSLALVDAVSVETGGDGLIMQFTGDCLRIDESLLERALLELARDMTELPSVDPVLMRLLSHESMRTSMLAYSTPIAAYIYRVLGHKGVDAFFTESQKYMSGEQNSFSFLSALPVPQAFNVIKCIESIVTLRKPKVSELLKQLQA